MCVRKLEENPAVKAVVITSPTYEGIHSDIKALAEVVHEYDAVLLVDEAHGAHVSLDKAFGSSAIAGGADMAVQSTHKSMNALTQASMLHVGTESIDLNKLESWLSMLQSSSPSYVLMSSLEQSLDDMGPVGVQKAQKLVAWLKTFRCRLYEDLKLKTLSDDDIVDTKFKHDISKLVVFMKDC